MSEDKAGLPRFRGILDEGRGRQRQAGRDLFLPGRWHVLFRPADTLHGFHNDAALPRVAAREAWEKTVALFERRLR